MKKIEAIIDPEIFPEVSTRRRACWLICWMMSGRIAPRRRIVG